MIIKNSNTSKYDKIFFSTFGILNKSFSGEGYIIPDHFLQDEEDFKDFNLIEKLIYFKIFRVNIFKK